jgi:hypothetical protein
MPCWPIRGALASARDADLATPDWELPWADLCAQQRGCTPNGWGRVRALELGDSSAAALRSLGPGQHKALVQADMDAVDKAGARTNVEARRGT